MKEKKILLLHYDKLPKMSQKLAAEKLTISVTDFFQKITCFLGTYKL